MYFLIRRQRKFTRQTQTKLQTFQTREVKILRIEIRNDSVLLDGYVNAVARDSKPMLDEKGEKFVEQICPKTFERAVEKSNDILCLLNHEPSRKLGSTKEGNIELFEDNIGLRAICNITDSEVIKKAKENKLRGWSFGFEAVKEHEEQASENLKRRFVDDMNLFEVSIIDDRKIPCYVGTSIETRADKNSKIEYRGEKFQAKILNYQKQVDYSAYEKILNKIKGAGVTPDSICAL